MQAFIYTTVYSHLWHDFYVSVDFASLHYGSADQIMSGISMPAIVQVHSLLILVMANDQTM